MHAFADPTPYNMHMLHPSQPNGANQNLWSEFREAESGILINCHVRRSYCSFYLGKGVRFGARGASFDDGAAHMQANVFRQIRKRNAKVNAPFYQIPHIGCTNLQRNNEMR